MPRADRQKVIGELEKLLESPVITYVTGDRHPAIHYRISDDAVRVLYSHLDLLGSGDKKISKINLFLYTRGGMLVAPPRIVRLIREYAEEFYTLVPYRSHSAGTSLCLGSDGIYMGKMGELSPIDPSTSNPYNPQAIQGDPRNVLTKIPISVEDVSAYLSLARDMAGLVSEQQNIEVFRALTDKYQPLALGNVQRVYNVIRSLTPELLAFQLKTPEEKIKIPEITKALTETYTHSHLICRDFAEEIGLKVIKPKKNVESAMWKLYEVYEKDLQLREIFDPEEIIGDQPSATVTYDVAFIESMARGDVYSIEVEITRTPRPLQQQLTLPLQLRPPPQVRPPPSGQPPSSPPSPSTPPPSAPTQLPPQPPAQLPQVPTEFAVKLKPKGWKQIIEEREESEGERNE